MQSLDAHYDNRAAIPEFPSFLARWQAESAIAREQSPHFSQYDYLSELAFEATDSSRLAVVAPPSGTNRCRIHFFPVASKAPRPLLVFFHGGYWRSLGPEFFYFIAPQWNQCGVHVALVGYDLCPQVGIDQIAEQSGAAMRWLSAQSARLRVDKSRVLVCGHSAGGHLAAMMVSAPMAEQQGKSPAGAKTADKGIGFELSGCLSLSGVFDLLPLMKTAMNADLRIDAQAAELASPARRSPLPYILTEKRLALFVGKDELQGFHDQQSELIRAWGLKGRAVAETLPGLNHFSIVNQLITPDSQVFQTARQMMGLDQ